MSMQEPIASAEEEPSLLHRWLAFIPRILSHPIHLLWLLVLLVWLVPVAVLLPQWVPTNVALALGNYTNVSSALGAAIAAGAGITVIHHVRAARREQAEHHRRVQKMLTDHNAHMAAAIHDLKKGGQ